MNIRKAISIGRFVQERLRKLHTCGVARRTGFGRSGEEVLYLDLHPLSQKVNKSFLVAFLERELIIAVNEAGVNLNAAIQNPHRHAQLSFVCGLGKIKAHDMVGKIKKLGGGMVSRKVDLREKAILTRLVFANAAGFLRIRDFPSAHLNPVDDTRIHPETYLSRDQDGLGHNLLQTMIQHALADYVEEDELESMAVDDDASWGEFAMRCIKIHRDHYWTTTITMKTTAASDSKLTTLIPKPRSTLTTGRHASFGSVKETMTSTTTTRSSMILLANWT